MNIKENSSCKLLNVFSKIVGGPPHTLVRMTAQVVMMVATGQCDNRTLRLPAHTLSELTNILYLLALVILTLVLIG